MVGFKFCWVVVSCPKRFFLKKKNINRVNRGRGGVDDPPPENSRVKIVLGCCYYCYPMVNNKFQTSRTILSGRIRVPVGWSGGVK